MEQLKIILLPGFDGTGMLFQPLLPYLSSNFTAEVISFPTVGMQDYSTLLPFVQNKLPKDEGFVLLAESFSGPLAIKIATNGPKNLKGLIICASFLTSPHYIPKIFRKLISSFAFKLPHLDIFLKYFLLGLDSSPELVSLMKNSLSETASSTLTSRLRSIFDSDVTSLMSRISIPVLYISPTNDRVIPRHISESIQSFGVKVISVPGPHCILQREPEKSAIHIKEFCGTLYNQS